MIVLFLTLISYQVSVSFSVILIPITESLIIGSIFPITVFYLSSILGIVSFFAILFSKKTISKSLLIETLTGRTSINTEAENYFHLKKIIFKFSLKERK